MENNFLKLSKAPRDLNVRNGISINHDESGSPLNPTREEEHMENKKKKNHAKNPEKKNAQNGISGINHDGSNPPP